MATLTELRSLFGDSALLEKVEAALIISADGLVSGTPTAEQKNWASNVFSNPNSEASKALNSLLAANAGVTVAQIQNATDVTIQANVDSVTQTLVDAFNA